MDLVRDGLLAGAAALAGAINAVAGGGTLISFPAAIAWGLPSTVANATNAVAMAPGSLASAWTYRRELGGDLRAVATLCVPAVVGGVVGAAILHHTSQRLFDAIIPWLVLGATLMILFQGLLERRGAAPHVLPAAAAGGRAPGRTAAAVVCQLLVGVYGGYFGAAMGIVTLAFLSLIVEGNMHKKNAIKNLLAALVNGVASLYYVVVGLVSGRAALIMVAGAVTGGLAGARLARRASPRAIRVVVVIIGVALSALLAWRAYAAPAPPAREREVARRPFGAGQLRLVVGDDGVGQLRLTDGTSTEQPVPCDRLTGAWGLWVADVDLDGQPEAIVTLRKPARFNPVVANRLHVYHLVDGQCVPAWRGTRLAGRFNRVAPDGDSLLALERVGGGRQRIARYRWAGFGYRLEAVLWQGQRSPARAWREHVRRQAP